MKKDMALTLKDHKTNSFARIGKFLLKITPYASGFLVSALFLYAAYNKLAIFTTFAKQLTSSPLVHYLPVKWHPAASYTLAVLVLALEIIIPALYLFKRTRMAAFYSSFFLMTLFTIYVFVVPHLFFNLQTCSCGGIISGFTWKNHFYFNLGFLGLSVAGLACYEQLIKRNA